MGRRKSWQRIALWLLVAACMAVIFAFSAQPAAASSQTSGWVIRWLLSRFDGNFSGLSPEEQLLRMEAWSHAVRKLAHFTIFALLGFFAFGAFSMDMPSKRAFPAALVLGTAWGILDEIHQLFVPGRSCEFADMCIDGAGALLGTALSLLILLFIKHRKIKKLNR